MRASSWSSASNAMSAGSSPAGFGLHDEISVLVDADPVHGGDARVGGGEGARGRVIGLGYGFFAPREFQFGVAVVNAFDPQVDDDGYAGGVEDQLRGWGAPVWNCPRLLRNTNRFGFHRTGQWSAPTGPWLLGQPLQPRAAIRHEVTAESRHR